MASPIPRLLAYVRPYLGLVGAALVNGLVAQLCRVGLAALPKPLLDAATGSAGSSPFADLPLPLAEPWPVWSALRAPTSVAWCGSAWCWWR